MTPAISFENVTKTYPGKPPVEAVRGLSMTVPAGECFGLLGPNGAGKTTTLEMVEGLLPPTSGSIRIFGEAWGRDDSALRGRIGISLQETRLPDKLTVAETVRMFRSFYTRGLTPTEAIDRVSLGEKAGAYVEKLSGGQKQRLAVACALVGDPDLLFLDEPTTGLDPQSRRQLWDVIRTLKNRGKTVVLTTHYMDEAEQLCDRVAVVDRGKIIAEGTPAALIRQLGGEHVVEIEFASESDATEKLKAVEGVCAVERSGPRYRLTVAEPHRVLPALLERTRAAGLTLAGLTTRTATLEDVFVSLTGRHLRDDEGRA